MPGRFVALPGGRSVGQALAVVRWTSGTRGVLEAVEPLSTEVAVEATPPPHAKEDIAKNVPSSASHGRAEPRVV
jgi:hypothetical protein